MVQRDSSSAAAAFVPEPDEEVGSCTTSGFDCCIVEMYLILLLYCIVLLYWIVAVGEIYLVLLLYC